MSKITRTTFFQILLSIFAVSLLISLLHGNSKSTDSEETILLKLKRHWSNPPSINHWTSSPPNSNSSIHCNWPEITCSNGSVTRISLINKTITGLSLIDKTITGPIPPFICDLKNLTAIDLQYNCIPGPFPTALYNCTKLEHLDLSKNLFVGCIPGDVDQLSIHLRTFNLSHNNFTCNILAAIGWFPELTTLRLYLNEFNASFPPEIGNLSRLEMLELWDNEFASMIDESPRNIQKPDVDLRSKQSRVRSRRMKPKLGNSSLKAIIPSTRRLLQTVQSTPKMTNLARGMVKARGRTHVNLLSEMPIKKSILNIRLIRRPRRNSSDIDQCTDSSHLGNRSKCLLIINTILLRETSGNQTCFVALKRPIRMSLDFVDPFATNQLVDEESCDENKQITEEEKKLKEEKQLEVKEEEKME
ncbi:hypothetical protein HYC85_000425 [Camellia sinensis]|uniref:Leucine-rich repeat-containing N-terminal plant-type domain-containing protein n=1 Tax=Camellia sinensis TaxID=4442 RepID=A0A7J7I420_CAMSI|nr:hypothetical protein HYC85_000425 [Camellia sinensis]